MKFKIKSDSIKRKHQPQTIEVMDYEMILIICRHLRNWLQFNLLHYLQRGNAIKNDGHQVIKKIK